FWVGTGSQDEQLGEAGISHFIEHMVFKGTTHRSARGIAEEMDAVGGNMNAFTSKECTCFYAKVVDEHLRLATDMVCDLALNPVFDAEELEKEKGVVLEEIAMAEDTPEDLVHDVLMEAHYGDQCVARPILGTEEAIKGYKRDDLAAYWDAMYRPSDCVFSVAGNYDWEQVKALVHEFTAGWRAGDARPNGETTHAVSPTARAREKDIEQVHICLGFPGLPIGDPRQYELALFNSVYGGAMSSRLFQKIREESGMVYTVYSCPNAYVDTGMLSVYAATNPDTAEQVYDMILSETAKIAEGGLTPTEFNMAKEQLKSAMILGGESTSARQQSNGRRMLLLNDTRTESEVIERINGTRFEDTNALMHELLTAK
ncbi:MAG: insulinase family protein, partial [Oscillospiraceae bacterium]|nr:insulinase family protein [Oscillospiraceae bacterium]